MEIDPLIMMDGYNDTHDQMLTDWNNVIFTFTVSPFTHMHVTLYDTHDQPCNVPNADISVLCIAAISATNKFLIYTYTGATSAKRYQWYLLHELKGQDGHYLLAANVALHWTPQVQASIADQLHLKILRIRSYRVI